MATSQACCIRQVDEKHLTAEIELMVWSPKMDLIAVCDVQCQVILYRLSWQKVWTLPAPAEEVKVTALAWRPDGKVVAVGYSTGHMVLCDIENSDILHSCDVIGGISHMTWISQVFADNAPWTFKPYVEDNSEVYLPKLQPHTKSYDASKKGHSEEAVEDHKKLKSQKELNILIVGTDRNTAHLYVYGVYPIALIHLQIDTNANQTCTVCSAVLSHDLAQLSLVVKTGHNDQTHYQYSVYDTGILLERHREIRLLALKYGYIYSLLDYLTQTVALMCEAWEDILVEMDKKLLKFAEEKQNFGVGTVSNDLLELLMFGTASSQLEAFLLHDLTEKGLKKLGHSIETSYSNIQKLVVKHLRSVSHTLLYTVSELRGVSRWTFKYGQLGLDLGLMETALQTAGSFVLKTSELQQVIDGSITTFKAFFRWLYVAILRLSDQVPNADISKMTQCDINFVAEFLKDNFSHFSEEDGEDSPSSDHPKQGFKLEKVGQYLKNEPLPYPANVSANPWVQFLQNSTYTKGSNLLYPPEREKSLTQVQNSLTSCLNAALHRPSEVIGEATKCRGTFLLCSAPSGVDNSGAKFSQRSIGGHVYTAYLPSPGHKLYLVRHALSSPRNGAQAEVACITLSRLPWDTSHEETAHSDRHDSPKFIDVSFYDDTTLSLLVEGQDDGNTPALLQLPLSCVENLTFTPMQTDMSVLHNVKPRDVSADFDPVSCLLLDNMRAASFAVSGTRKVACVLFSSHRRVRLFLMDADDDDEDETLDDTEMEGSVLSPKVTDMDSEDKENVTDGN